MNSLNRFSQQLGHGQCFDGEPVPIPRRHAVGRHEFLDGGLLQPLDALLGDQAMADGGDDELIGWDTDQFPTNLYTNVEVMLIVLGMGGFTTGGLNFDAKRRRESHEPVDLFHAHIGGMDAFARGLKIAAAIQADGRFEEFVKARYATFDSGVGKTVEDKTATLESLSAYALSHPEPVLASGRQEMLENILNDYM